MAKISKRTINLMASLLEAGYTRERINLFFKGLDVPEDILTKHSGGKEIYSKKVMFELHDIDSEESKKLLIDIVKGLLIAEGANVGYYLSQAGYPELLENLKLALENDGFKVVDGKLISIMDEDFETEENLLNKELKRLGFEDAITYLNQSYDNFISGNWEAANSSTRTTLEYITTEIARNISNIENENPNLNGHKAVRGYLRIKLFDEQEFSILTQFMHWCSSNGPHPGMSDENECRLRRIFTIGLCQYYLEKYQSKYCK